MTKNQEAAASILMQIGRVLSERGWLRATSGNLSLRDTETGLTYITRSGADKQRLTVEDVLSLDPDGAIQAGQGKPSFETAIHRAIYQSTDAGAVFHIHTIYNNLVTRHAGSQGLRLSDHEMLKALGHWDERAAITVPVVPNYADIDRVARAISGALDNEVPGILLERHGIYAFGKDTAAALRHLEAFEFLFEWLCLDQLTLRLQLGTIPANPAENIV